MLRVRYLECNVSNFFSSIILVFFLFLIRFGTNALKNNLKNLRRPLMTLPPTIELRSLTMTPYVSTVYEEK